MFCVFRRWPATIVQENSPMHSQRQKTRKEEIKHERIRYVFRLYVCFDPDPDRTVFTCKGNVLPALFHSFEHDRRLPRAAARQTGAEHRSLHFQHRRLCRCADHHHFRSCRYQRLLNRKVERKRRGEPHHRLSALPVCGVLPSVLHSGRADAHRDPRALSGAE